ncbi:3'-5' exonuclease [Rummeliibacillus stabekisii]|uniref:3'-5' exonuclease n=1 Tax=Rummeliibacillus stabekisii TaxID=241244 RepID=UPI00371DB56F
MYTVIDFETTGLDASSCQVIQVGAVKLDSNFNEVGRLKINVALRKGTELPEKITELTGITEKDLAEGLPEYLAHMILDMFIDEDVVVAQFASFDLSFMPLRDCYDFICTKSVFNVLHPYEKASLTNIVDYYGLEHLEHHTALDDADMTAKVLKELDIDLREHGKNLTEFVNIMTEQENRPLRYIPVKAKVINY